MVLQKVYSHVVQGGKGNEAGVKDADEMNVNL